uniref:Uncharacterized protein n=1 Tax=Oryza nivara TaxID=4536 RepID=A0A0E0FHL7_ORYNI
MRRKEILEKIIYKMYSNPLQESIRKKKMKHVERTILPVVAFVGYILAHEETRTRGRHEGEHGFLAHPAARLPGPA